MAAAEEYPAARSMNGNSTEMREERSDELVRIAVTGSEEKSRGFNSPRGERSLPPRTKK